MMIKRIMLWGLLLPFMAFTSCKEKYLEVHKAVMVIDTHTDTPMELLRKDLDLGQRHLPPDSRVDFPRLREGMVDGIFFGLYTGQSERIASHSSVRSVCDHPRNMSDEMIKALAKNGGVLQLCILDDYIKAPDTSSVNYLKKEELRKKYHNWNYKNDEEKKAAWAEWDAINRDFPPVLPSVSDAVDHIDYVVNLVGIDHIGIGSDFDGGGGLADCQDVADFPNITKELLERGYSKEAIGKIWGANFLRVMKDVENLAAE